MAAPAERSTSIVRRRITIRTTTIDSLTSSSSPVMRPVRTKSSSRLTDSSANSAPTSARAATSRSHVERATAASPSGANRIVDKVILTGAIEELTRDARFDAAIAAGHTAELQPPSFTSLALLLERANVMPHNVFLPGASEELRRAPRSDAAKAGEGAPLLEQIDAPCRY